MTAYLWTRCYTSSSCATVEALRDTSVDLVRYLHERLVHRLDVALDTDGAVAVGALEFHTARDLPRNVVLFRAEVLALALRHPNPYPHIHLFRWLPNRQGETE